MPPAPSLPGRPFADLRVAQAGLLLILLLLATLLAGCSPYKIVGVQGFRFGEKLVLPRELAGQDLHGSCAAAHAFTPLTLGLEHTGAKGDRMIAMALFASGFCTGFEAQEQELAVLRALRNQQPLPAQDARIVQKRLYQRAARRELMAYQRFLSAYGDRPEGDCPTFANDTDELIYLAGLLAGLQAMVNSVQAGQMGEVPQDIPPKTVARSRCIAAGKWWDLPEAMRTAIWSVLPLLAPEDVPPPMLTLQRIAAQGKQGGVRLGHVVWALAASNAGDIVTTRAVLRDFVAVDAHWQPDPQYRILDVIATEMMQAVSDQLWTVATGHRTPFGGLGTFWDDAPVQANLDDLL